MNPTQDPVKPTETPKVIICGMGDSITVPIKPTVQPEVELGKNIVDLYYECRRLEDELTALRLAAEEREREVAILRAFVSGVAVAHPYQSRLAVLGLRQIIADAQEVLKLNPPTP